MAESNDSLLQLHNIEVEENNNQPQLENNLNNELEHREHAPSNNENGVSLKDASSELSNCVELNFDGVKIPEFSAEMPASKIETVNLQTTNDESLNCDFGIHDSENNIIKNSKLIDFTNIDLNLSNGSGAIIPNFESECNGMLMKDEEFHDAVQFFKDPTSLTFLENAGASTAAPDSLISRSSLYMNFDPLHAKFNSQSLIKTAGLQEIFENDIEHQLQERDVDADTVPTVVKKHIANASLRESVGNVLISFDSPVNNRNDSTVLKIENSEQPPKLYTEEELQQALKIQELNVQETFLKRQHDLELDRTKRQQEMEKTVQQLSADCFTLHGICQEFVSLASSFSEKENLLKDSLENAEKENAKLTEDLKTSVEDLQSVESTFSDFHKRYEQCKSMLKVYTQNEDNLKQQLENLKSKLLQQEDMYKALQSRTQETLDKANTEVANAKKAGDAQIAVLKAQLKKAELKISSLESDVKHVKIENGKLSSICDELMAKVSET